MSVSEVLGKRLFFLGLDSIRILPMSDSNPEFTGGFISFKNSQYGIVFVFHTYFKKRSPYIRL
jgi:hypothetical protein